MIHKPSLMLLLGDNTSSNFLLSMQSINSCFEKLKVSSDEGVSTARLAFIWSLQANTTHNSLLHVNGGAESHLVANSHHESGAREETRSTVTNCNTKVFHVRRDLKSSIYKKLLIPKLYKYWIIIYEMLSSKIILFHSYYMLQT